MWIFLREKSPYIPRGEKPVVVEIHSCRRSLKKKLKEGERRDCCRESTESNREEEDRTVVGRGRYSCVLVYLLENEGCDTRESLGIGCPSCSIGVQVINIQVYLIVVFDR